MTASSSTSSTTSMQTSCPCVQLTTGALSGHKVRNRARKSVRIFITAVYCNYYSAKLRYPETGREASPPGRHCLSSRREVFLPYSAERAHPVLGNILEGCSRGDSIVRIAGGGIIFIPAHIANVLFHSIRLFLGKKNTKKPQGSRTADGPT